MRDFLTLDQAAGELGADRDQVYGLVRRGEIPGTWIPDVGEWYIERRELEAYRRASARG